MRFYVKNFIIIAFLFSACSQHQSETSINETLRQYVQAVKEKNLAKIKDTASKKTVQLMEETAKEQGMTLEEAVQKNESVISPILQNLETRNEKINDNRATVEIRNKYTDSWIEFTLVREDGRWKIGAGEMFYEAMDLFKKFDNIDKEIEKSNWENKKAK